MSPNPLRLDLWWIVTPNLHDRLPRSPTHDHTDVTHVSNLPNALGGLGQIPDVLPRLGVKQPDPAVVATGDEEVLIELEGGDGGIVSGDALEDRESFEGEGDDATVRASCGQNCGRELNLAHERGVAL